MTKVALFKQDGSNAGEIELNDSIFGIEPNNNVVTDAVLMQRASMRQGTHAVKVQSVLHNGVVVVLSSDLLHVHTPTSCQRRFTVWH